MHIPREWVVVHAVSNVKLSMTVDDPTHPFFLRFGFSFISVEQLKLEFSKFCKHAGLEMTNCLHMTFLGPINPSYL